MIGPLVKAIATLLFVYSAYSYGDELQLADELQLPQEAYAASDQYAQTLIRECPPDKCVLMSVGMTNALLDSYLRQHMRDQGIVSSYLHYLPYRNLISINNWHEDIRGRWLADVLPSREILEGKTLVLVRNLYGGFTLEVLFAELSSLNLDLGAFMIYSHAEGDPLPRGQLSYHRTIENTPYINLMAKRGLIGRDQDSVYDNPVENYHRFSPVNLGNAIMNLMSTNRDGRAFDLLLKRYGQDPMQIYRLRNQFSTADLETDIRDYAENWLASEARVPQLNPRHLELDALVQGKRCGVKMASELAPPLTAR